jgi:hypothetical protein
MAVFRVLWLLEDLAIQADTNRIIVVRSTVGVFKSRSLTVKRTTQVQRNIESSCKDTECFTYHASSLLVVDGLLI